VTGKSQIKSQFQITDHLTKRFKSLCQITNEITNQITVPNHKSFDKKILKSLCQINWEADKNNPSSGDMSIIITEEGGV